jgi:hypothetical protein
MTSSPRRFLYLLPETVYRAEVIPGKKENSFVVSQFHQISGTFIDDDVFLPEALEKLFPRIDPDAYTLVLPDYLFTSIILTVQESGESAVRTHIKQEILPSLDLSSDSHQILIEILTQHGGKTQVQLTALENSLIEPLMSRDVPAPR